MAQRTANRSPADRTEWDVSRRHALDPLERWNLTIGAGAVLASVAAVSPAFGLSVALGAAIEAVNFRSLLRGSQWLFSGGSETLGRLWALGFGLRFVFLAVAIWLAIDAGAHPIGLVLGLSTIVPAVVVGAWRQRPPPSREPPQPGLPPDDPSWDEWDLWRARERPRNEDDEEEA